MDSSSVGIPVDAPDGYLLDVEYAVRITSRGLFVHSAPWAVNSLGYENVSHYAGGKSDWVAGGLPLEGARGSR